LKLSYTGRKSITGYIFVSPWIIGSVVLLIFPLVFSLILSVVKLENVDFSNMSFVGIEHYKRAFTVDMEYLPLFWTMVSDTLINTPMIVISSLIIAIMLSRNIKGRGFFRLVFFLPVLLGAGYIMQQVLGQKVDQEATKLARGILLPDAVQEYLGVGFTNAVMAFFDRITIVLWKSGVQIIIALAGIQGISSSLYESARVDGAMEWEMFWKITLPMISPILLLNTVYTLISSLTESGNMIDFITGKIFGQSSLLEYEYSSALGWIYFIFILFLVLLVFLIMKPFTKNVAENDK